MEACERAASLALWSGAVEPVPLGGGITNTSFVVEDRGARFVVRVGHDIPCHGIVRASELAASRAAAAAGISPAVVHAEQGILVLRYVDGRTLAPEEVRGDLPRIVELIKRAHRDVPQHLRGPVPMFWVFHVLRDYACTLRDDGFRLAHRLAEWLAVAQRLERAVGPIEIVFGHNDLLAANLIDDGARLWLIDWDYGGFNSPLFDLGGLASNNGLDEKQREWLLAAYHDRPVTDDLRRSAQAMLVASLLREAMWSMVSELHASVDFDFSAYTTLNLTRFEHALAGFEAMDR